MSNGIYVATVSAPQRETAPAGAAQRVPESMPSLDVLAVKTVSRNSLKDTFFIKKNPIGGTSFFKIIGPPVGFFLSADNALEMPDRARECAWYFFYLCEIDPAIGHEGTAAFRSGPTIGFGVFSHFVFVLPVALFGHISHVDFCC